MEDEVALVRSVRAAGCDRVVETGAICPCGIEIHLDLGCPVAGPVRSVTVKPRERSVARSFTDKRMARAIFGRHVSGIAGRHQRHQAIARRRRVVDRVGRAIEAADEFAGRICLDHRRVIGAGDGDGDVDSVDGTVRIGDSCGEGFRVGLAGSKRLGCRCAIVHEIGPHAGVGVDGEIAVGASRIAGPLQQRSLSGIDVCGGELPGRRRQQAIGLVEGQCVVGLAFVSAVDRPAGQAQIVDRLGQFGMQRRLRIRIIRAIGCFEELVGQRRAVEVAEQVVMQALQTLWDAVAVVVGLELGDHVDERRTAALDVLRILKAKTREGLVDIVDVVGAVIGIEMLPDRGDRVGHRGHTRQAEHALQQRAHVVIVARGSQQGSDVAADRGEIGDRSRRRG